MSQPFIEPCARGAIEAEPCPRAARREPTERAKRRVLVGCVLASSMAFIDGSALTVALPDIRARLGADIATLQWVLNGYVLALAALTLIGGALADAYGKARMVRLGCALFGAASVACALAPSAEWLIGARVFQGVAAAILTPASLALIGAAFPKEERSRAIGIWAAASALTTAGGPLLGGWLTETFGWPAIFWINPPLALGAVLILGAARFDDVVEKRRFDLVGALLIGASLFAVAWALTAGGPGEAGALEGAAPADGAGAVWPWALAGLLGVVAFILWERRTPAPMTPPRLFADRSFSVLNLATLGIYAALAAAFFVTPFELIERRGLAPSVAGAVFLPFTLGVGLLSRLFGGLADKTGPRPLLIGGAAGAAAGFGLFAVLSDQPLALGILLPMAVLGLSFAVFVAPLTAAVMSSVPARDEGLASGVNNTASRVAQLLGVALAAAIGASEAGYRTGMAAAAAAALLSALLFLALPRAEAAAPERT